MTTFDQCAVAVEPGALLATAPGTTTLEQFNHALATYRLHLPVDPLTPGLQLADLVAWNAGGRRRLRHGTVARYLRAALLEGPDGLYTIGGPTIKRATGYGLNRAICGGALALGALHEVTFSLRPLPAARVATLLALPDPVSACQLGTALLAAGLALSALAFTCAPDGAILVLAELEETAAVVQRQQAALEQIAAAHGAATLNETTPWARWEDLAARHRRTPVRLDLSVPQVVVPTLISRSTSLAHRYGLDLTLWGEIGVGALHLGLHGDPQAARALRAILQHLAESAGGSITTELGLDWEGMPVLSLPLKGEASVIGRPLSPPPPTPSPHGGGGAAPPPRSVFCDHPPPPGWGRGGRGGGGGKGG
ncbi:MAG: FAD-binding oxidoreductase, partial [Oscillochloridaceae bacterium umkhey_bin13]